MLKMLLAATALTLAGPALAHEGHAHAPAKGAHAGGEHMLHAALADANRPQADKDRDAVRKPADLLALLDLKPGAKVADFIMGGGYWTRILSNAVGPAGGSMPISPPNSSSSCRSTAPIRTRR